MKRNAGFSLIELLVAMAITVIIVLVALDALTQAQHASEGVSMMSDMVENLRAGMDNMTQDLVLAGSGIPTGGISIPAGGGPAINRPSPTGFAYTFVDQTNAPLTAIPAVDPGFQLGPTIDGAPGAANTDMVTVIYADNLTFGPLNPPIGVPLSLNAINDPTAVAPSQPCNGTIDPSGNGAYVTFDTNCITLPTAGNGAIVPGDLIMFSNPQGNTIECVTSVNTATNTLNFSAGAPDLYGLNATAGIDATGTMKNLMVGGSYPQTFATRIWMITYYLDNTNPASPRLMRQVNFNPAKPVAESIEGLQIAFNFVNGNPLCGAVCTNQPVPPAGMNANQMMSVNLFLAARSEKPFSWTQKYFRNNLSSQISLRGLAFFNQYN
ncbi:MAG: PulJ/GspJ family protein [Candidatus Acidiferrales bacterium]